MQWVFIKLYKMWNKCAAELKWRFINIFINKGENCHKNDINHNIINCLPLPYVCKVLRSKINKIEYNVKKSHSWTVVTVNYTVIQQ